MTRWHEHPATKLFGKDKLTLGQRSADALRNGMGSWGFVFISLVLLAIWMLFNGNDGFDPYPFILLNLVLSCVAALQGAILLIAARREDQINSELAVHTFQIDQENLELTRQVHELATKIDKLTQEIHHLVSKPKD
jgi:uncharacterized membrane protein